MTQKEMNTNEELVLNERSIQVQLTPFNVSPARRICACISLEWRLSHETLIEESHWCEMPSSLTFRVAIQGIMLADLWKKMS